MEDTDNTESTTTNTSAPAEAVNTPATAPETEEAKPYLGGDTEEKKDATPAPAEGEKAEADKDGKEGEDKSAEPKEYAEEDYVKGIVKDEKLLGDDKRVTLHEGYIKAMAPTFKECGVSPEQANKLANAFAKAQIDEAREQMKSRNEYFEKMKQESLRKYTESDWKQINAAIDANFKVGGTMNYVIRNSELGADPEFLAFLHKAGAAVKEDGVAGATAGAGEGVGDANTFSGLSKMW